jgi:acyl carrier protein
MHLDAATIRRRIYERTAELAALPQAEINEATTLEGIGLDSSDAVVLALEVEELTGQEVDVGVFLRFATLGEAVDDLIRTLDREPAGAGLA